MDPVLKLGGPGSCLIRGVERPAGPGVAQDIKEILKVELVVFFTSKFSLIESHMDCVLQCVQNEQMDYNSR